jgi:drug/metabolite transporter (DMT)-like permease
MDGGGRGIPDTLTLGAFAVVTLGAGNFLAVRMSNLELPPFWRAGLRFGLAAVSFVVISVSWRLVLLVVRRWTASVTSYMFVLFPVVTMALEASILAEPVTGQMLVGAALVMVGVCFGALSPAARRAPGKPATLPATPVSQA